jgi:hypothetical protein
MRRHARQMQSFGGGVGLAYVFLQLFPEIDNVYEWMGEHVHLITLLSFLAFYALEVWLVVRASRRLAQRDVSATEEAAGEGATVFWLHVGIVAFYTAMIVFALPDEIAEDALFAVVGGLTIGIHLVCKDYAMRCDLDERFQSTGRYVLAAAPLVGWAAHRLLDPSEELLDVSMAVLAGLLIQSVFRDEVPRPDRAAFGWILVGVATFAALSFLN